MVKYKCFLYCILLKCILLKASLCFWSGSVQISDTGGGPDQETSQEKVLLVRNSFPFIPECLPGLFISFSLFYFLLHSCVIPIFNYAQMIFRIAEVRWADFSFTYLPQWRQALSFHVVVFFLFIVFFLDFLFHLFWATLSFNEVILKVQTTGKLEL